MQVEVLGPLRATDGRPRRHARGQPAATAVGAARAAPGTGGDPGRGDRRAVAGSPAARSGGGAAQPSVPAPPRPARRRDRVDGQRLPPEPRHDRPRRRPPGGGAERARDPTDPAFVATIETVLARWHGPAYPELDDVDEGRAEAVGLGELRIRAVEARAESRLAAGVTDEMVVELAALADEEPLRERPRALLMTALGEDGPHRRGAAGLRRLPAAARRASSGSSRRRPWPPCTPACSMVARRRHGRRRAASRLP